MNGLALYLAGECDGPGGTSMPRHRLVIDTAAFVAYLDGDHLDLTPSEFDVLTVLAKDPERVVMHEDLARAVFGGLRAESHELCRQALRHHITRLRRKLRDRGAEMVWCSWGRGYRLLSPRRPHRVIVGDGAAEVPA